MPIRLSSANAAGSDSEIPAARGAGLSLVSGAREGGRAEGSLPAIERSTVVATYALADVPAVTAAFSIASCSSMGTRQEITLVLGRLAVTALSLVYRLRTAREK